MWLIGFFLAFADDDLPDLKIPANAVVRPVAFRPWSQVKTKKVYVVGKDVVGERLFYGDGKVADERPYPRYPINGEAVSEAAFIDLWLDANVFLTTQQAQNQIKWGIFKRIKILPP